MRKDCKDKSSFSILQIFFSRTSHFIDFHRLRKGFQLLYCKPSTLVRTVLFSNADAKVTTKSEPANIFATFLRKKLKKSEKRAEREEYLLYMTGSATVRQSKSYRLKRFTFPPGVLNFAPEATSHRE